MLGRQCIINARAEFNLAEAQLRIATKALEDTVIKAPFDGTVAWTYVERYEDVEAKQPILRVVDTSRIEFIVNLPESYMPYMPFVHDLRVQFDSFPDTVVPAQIKEIATEASETTRTYAVNLIMDQPEGMKILPGMAGKANGDVTLPETAPEEGIIVPVSAVYSPLGQQSYIWVIDEQSGTVSRREVVTQGLRDTGIPVMEGLQAGEWIATAGVSFLKEGQKVRIVEPEGS